MSRHLKLVVVNGSPHSPSRTVVVLRALSVALEKRLPARTQTVELADLVPEIGVTLSRDALAGHAEAALQAIEQADVLLVGAPVFRGSVPGLFKHLFDLVRLDALVGKPVLLAATGGSERHALVIDHQLRPLFGFFQALTLPTGVYASTSDFDDYRLSSPALLARIELAAGHAADALARSFGEPRNTDEAHASALSASEPL